jgi:excisionase family DNA binding protein
MSTPPLPLAVPVKKAMQMLHLSQMTLYRMMCRGEFPYLKIGRSRRIDVRDIENLMRRNRRGGDSP